jgi:hypothetical protein
LFLFCKITEGFLKKKKKQDILLQRGEYAALVVRQGQVVLEPPIRTIHDARLDEYLRKRDDCRVGKTLWNSVTCRHAGMLSKKCGGLSTQAALNRIIWDKTWHGYNKGKGGGADSEGTRCQLCDIGIEDRNHILLHCPALAEARVEAIRMVKASMLMATWDKPWLRQLLHVTINQCISAMGAEWWTGMHQKENFREFLAAGERAATRQRGGQAGKQFLSSVKMMGTRYQAGALLINQMRTKLLAGEAEVRHVARRRLLYGARKGPEVNRITNYYTRLAPSRLPLGGCGGGLNKDLTKTRNEAAAIRLLATMRDCRLRVEQRRQGSGVDREVTLRQDSERATVLLEHRMRTASAAVEVGRERQHGVNRVYKRYGLLKKSLRSAVVWVKAVTNRLTRPLKERKGARPLNRFCASGTEFGDIIKRCAREGLMMRRRLTMRRRRVRKSIRMCPIVTIQAPAWTHGWGWVMHRERGCQGGPVEKEPPDPP